MKLSSRPFAFTSYKVFLKNQKRFRISLPTSFSTWFLKKNVFFVIFYYLTTFHCLVPFTPWDIGQYNLRKPIDFHWFKNVLLELFGLQLLLFFFHKMMRFYKDIDSAGVSGTSAELFFSQTDIIYVLKIQYKHLWSIEMYFHGFFQTEYVYCNCLLPKLWRHKLWN